MTTTDNKLGTAGSGAIRYAIGESSLGPVLVAHNGRGVCAILLGGTPETLAGDLRARFPQASVTEDGPGLAALMAKVTGFVEAPANGLDLPLDVQGTPFQRRVWQALREIPAGAIASYSDIATRIGAPRSARAVARACAENPIALAVPCHRVIRSDGGLSGYRWGAARKRALLDREAA
jgi:AraC family transcriptional regulator of adaptative response/methylated-DNA-[protein]-cysteine methyltransferase